MKIKDGFCVYFSSWLKLIVREHAPHEDNRTVRCFQMGVTTADSRNSLAHGVRYLIDGDTNDHMQSRNYFRFPTYFRLPSCLLLTQKSSVGGIMAKISDLRRIVEKISINIMFFE